MKEYTVHVFFKGEAQPMAAVTLDDRRYPPVPLSQAQLAVLADVATLAACREQELVVRGAEAHEQA